MQPLLHLTGDVSDNFEYHGHTAVEHIRYRAGRTIWRRWLVFDTVEEALAFYSEQDC